MIERGTTTFLIFRLNIHKKSGRVHKNSGRIHKKSGRIQKKVYGARLFL